nr:hypothetical protein CFP56_71248 [Quercus suber]
MGLNPKGRDWGNLVNWDSLGKTYAGIIVVWTIILSASITWLLWNRRLPYIRMRNLPLAITSTALLHVYLVKIFLAYTTNGHFLCSAEFWIMSVYLPLGIALFQANALQLRSISDQQQRLLERPLSPSSSLAGLLTRDQKQERQATRSWRALSQTQKGYVYIATGMLVQLIITSVLYATSPVLQGDWSSFPQDISHSKGQGLCRKSYAWQSTYARYYSREQYRSSNDSPRTMTRPLQSAISGEEQIAIETKHLFDDLIASGIPQGKGMYRMAALDRAIAINPAPLLYFAARKDFSAENILFLLQVRGWRSAWATATKNPATGEVITAAKEYLLKSAVQIFRDSITLTAEFPINIEDPVARNLREVLGPYSQQNEEQHPYVHAAQTMSNFFDFEHFAKNHGSTTNQWCEKKDDFNVTVISTVSTPTSSTAPYSTEHRHGATSETLAYKPLSTFDYPEGLNETLFDAAEASILYLVLTNTWRRFVQQQERINLPS